MAIKAIYIPGAKFLTVFGDAQNNNITLSRDAAGKIFVNGGAVPILGGTATVANTARIQVFGQDGNDIITMNEANGALPPADLFGGSGNDVITGGSGNDQIFGQDGNDTLLGKGGSDLMFGGAGNDVMTGGDADDQLFGEAGDDRMIWNPGDDTDLYRRRRRQRHDRGQRRQWRGSLHRHRQRHPGTLRPPRSGPVLDRHGHDGKPRSQHERWRRLLQRYR